MTEVTIVIPVYNRATYLPRLFRSLQTVSYEGKRAILVDNGSEDGSWTLCQEFARSANFPVQVLQEPAQGASHARNAGLQACQTPWVYFFDSDDELSPDFLDKVMPLCPGHDAVFLPTRMILPDGQARVRPFQPVFSASYQILSSMLNSPSMLLRTDWLRNLGGWDAQLSVWDDWELGIRVLLAQPRARWYDGEAFHSLYVHGNSITGPSMSHNLEGKIACLRKVQSMLQSRAERLSLYLRTRILEGELRKEACPAILTGFDTGISPIYKIIGSCLSTYVRLGGRGAWRVATWFVKQ